MQGTVRRARYRWWQGWTKWGRVGRGQRTCFTTVIAPITNLFIQMNGSACTFQLPQPFTLFPSCFSIRMHVLAAKHTRERFTLLLSAFFLLFRSAVLPKRYSDSRYSLTLSFRQRWNIRWNIFSIDKTIFNFQFFCILHVSNIHIV